MDHEINIRIISRGGVYTVIRFLFLLGKKFNNQFLGGLRADIMHENADVTTFELHNATSLSRMKSFTFPKQVLLVQFRVTSKIFVYPTKAALLAELNVTMNWRDNNSIQLCVFTFFKLS